MSYTNTTGTEDKAIDNARTADDNYAGHIKELIKIIERLDEQIEDNQKDAADREEGLQNNLDDSNQRVRELEQELRGLEKTVDRLEKELVTAGGRRE